MGETLGAIQQIPKRCCEHANRLDRARSTRLRPTSPFRRQRTDLRGELARVDPLSRTRISSPSLRASCADLGSAAANRRGRTGRKRFSGLEHRSHGRSGGRAYARCGTRERPLRCADSVDGLVGLTRGGGLRPLSARLGSRLVALACRRSLLRCRSPVCLGLRGHVLSPLSVTCAPPKTARPCVRRKGRRVATARSQRLPEDLGSKTAACMRQSGHQMDALEALCPGRRVVRR